MDCGKDKVEKSPGCRYGDRRSRGKYARKDTKLERRLWLSWIAIRIGWLLLHPQRIPALFWIWYDTMNIQPIPEYRSFTAEPKRRRVAAVQSQAGA